MNDYQAQIATGVSLILLGIVLIALSLSSCNASNQNNTYAEKTT